MEKTILFGCYHFLNTFFRARKRAQDEVKFIGLSFSFCRLSFANEKHFQPMSINYVTTNTVDNSANVFFFILGYIRVNF